MQGMFVVEVFIRNDNQEQTMRAHVTSDQQINAKGGPNERTAQQRDQNDKTINAAWFVVHPVVF